MKASTVAPTDMGVPVGVPQTFDEHIKLQFDLLALAFKADITRVGTLLFARDLTGRTYPESEAPTVGFPWRVASRRRSQANRRAIEDQPVSRQDAGPSHRETRQNARRRRDVARSFAGALWQQHGQLQSACPLRRAACAGRRIEREAQGRASSGLSDQDHPDRQSVIELAGHVRHSPGQHRRQHRPAERICKSNE